MRRTKPIDIPIMALDALFVTQVGPQKTTLANELTGNWGKS